MFSKKKVVITGGAGFIGSHTVDYFINAGADVYVIDNFSTGRPENLAHIKNINVTVADINDVEETKNIYSGASVVVHLAALADIVPSIERPLDYHHANVNGTVQVLEMARAAGVKKFIYAASASCYGIPNQFPTSESAEIRPEYPYAVTKYLGEEYVLNWGKIYKMDVVSLRFSNVFGPRSRTSGTYGAVFGVFLAQKIHQKPFTVVGDGTQSRDFCYVSDLVRAVGMAAASDIRQEVFNVGSGGHYTINELVALLGGEVTYIPKRPGEPDITFSDISKIKKMLGWTPQVSFKEGVQKLLLNIDYWKSAPVWDARSIEKATSAWFKYLSSGEKKRTDENN